MLLSNLISGCSSVKERSDSILLRWLVCRLFIRDGFSIALVRKGSIKKETPDMAIAFPFFCWYIPFFCWWPQNLWKRKLKEIMYDFWSQILILRSGRSLKFTPTSTRHKFVSLLASLMWRFFVEVQEKPKNSKEVSWHV